MMKKAVATGVAAIIGLAAGSQHALAANATVVLEGEIPEWDYFSEFGSFGGITGMSSWGGTIRLQLKANLAVPDSDPDPNVGKYEHAVEWFRLDAFGDASAGPETWSISGSANYGSLWLEKWGVPGTLGSMTFMDLHLSIGDFSFGLHSSRWPNDWLANDSLGAWVAGIPTLSSKPSFIVGTIDEGGQELQVDYRDSGNSATSAYWGRITYAAVDVPVVPEPETYAMFLAGLGLLGAAARRRKPKNA